MHILDIILTILGIIFLFLGIKRGLIGELIRLLAMTVGVIVAFLYTHEVIQWSCIKNLHLQHELKQIIIFLSIYLICAIIIVLIGRILKRIVHCTPLGWIDRILGAVIGLLKTGIIAYVVCLSISALPIRWVHDTTNDSFIYSTYRTLPASLSLKSLLKKRTNLRTMSKKKPAVNTISMTKKLEHFKTIVDSTKKALDSLKGD